MLYYFNDLLQPVHLQEAERHGLRDHEGRDLNELVRVGAGQNVGLRYRLLGGLVRWQHFR